MQTINLLYLKRAIDLSKESLEKGNHPFGAVLAINDTIVLESHNTVNTEKDITKHAELTLISMATKKFSPEILKSATLYASTEPCKMCAGAISNAGIPRVVFALSKESLAEFAPISELDTIYEGPLLEIEAYKIHEIYWNKTREQEKLKVKLNPDNSNAYSITKI